MDGPEVPYGLIRLRNTGSFGVAVAGIDSHGRLLQPHVYLEPGQAIASFVPPAHAVKIIMVGQKPKDNEPPPSGTAELEYDVPWFG